MRLDLLEGVRTLQWCGLQPSWVGSRTVARSCRHPARSGSTEVCPALSRPAWASGAISAERADATSPVASSFANPAAYDALSHRFLFGSLFGPIVANIATIANAKHPINPLGS
jgi:hypothetical protein